ncbi:MAG: YdiU family protein [Hyphomicrobiaceae bacterium]
MIPFENTYQLLPERFYQRIAPTPVAGPRLVKVNRPLAEELGIDAQWLASPEGLAMLAGNSTPSGAVPIALAYAGHQFGGFSPQLGDGRAILLGEVVDASGNRRDVQLKGSGPTAFSRRGDGRAALGPVLREYVISETMSRLGIPTTRALAAVLSGEYVLREGPLPGAVLARVAASHIRVGTFQYFAVRGDTEALRLLADHVIVRHYPDCGEASAPYRALLAAVVGRQARLVAQWLGVGFVHGVMNTDNMTVSGETIDYGPCAFLDEYHPEKVFSSIDQMGRYAFGNQPSIAQWNLARLAETLLPLLSDDEDEAVKLATAEVEGFGPVFLEAYQNVMAGKIGLATRRSHDLALVGELLSLMAVGKADFTLTFRALAHAAADIEREVDVVEQFAPPADPRPWLDLWRRRLAEEGGDMREQSAAMLRANPLYIPRNHLVEEMIAVAVEQDDFAPFETLLDVLSEPFRDQPGRERYAMPPQPHEIVTQTFCGT